MSSQLDIARLLPTADPPQLGPKRRATAFSEAKINSELKSPLENLHLPPERQELIRALVLLWHDHLETAHEISQNIGSADAAFVHGIMHRREPDYGNAAYWFRRVGNHPAFPTIAAKVSDLARTKGVSPLAQKLLRNGAWDPFAVIDACAAVAEKPDAEDEQQFLRNVQRIEMQTLLENLA